MRHKIKYLPLILILFYTRYSSAQSDLYVSSFVTDSVVYLRWYPKDPGVWQRMINNGVVVERMSLNAAKPKSGHTLLLHPGHFRPDWYRLDSIAGLPDGAKWGFVKEIVTGNHFISPETMGGLVNSLDEAQNGFLSAMMLIHSDPQLAADFGMMARDRITDKASKYIYMVYLRDSLNSDTQFLIADHKSAFELPGPERPQLQKQGSEIQINWNAPERHDPWFGFYIERSLDSGRNFVPLHELPIFYGLDREGFSNGFTDSPPLFSGLLQYRFHALNSFCGEGMYSDVSEIDFHSGILRTPSFVRMEDYNGEPCIYWQMDTSGLMSLSGFEIYRADSMEGFMELVGTTDAYQRQWIFTHPKYENYISVTAVFENGERRSSDPVFISLPDTLPPEPVKHVNVIVDTCGMVRLIWSPATEASIKGYQVYRSNLRNAEFSNLSKTWIADTCFTDTLDLLWLRDSIFYFVMVADNRYNEAASDTCGIMLPLQIKPATPLILSCILKNDFIEIHYTSSYDNQRIRYELYRSDNAGTAVLLQVLDSIISGPVMDGLIVPGHHYVYKMRAKNDNGMYSEWSPLVAVTVAENPIQERISVSGVWCDTAMKRVVISWELSASDVAHYRIYRLIEGRAETIGNVNGNVNEFVYRTTEKTDKSTYRIIAYYKDGRKSL